MNFGSGGSAAKKAWRDIWGAGQGLAAIKSVTSTAEFVARLTREYDEARLRLGAASRVEPNARRGIRDAGIVASTAPRIAG
jgi:nitronate monooxygenase